MQSKFSISALDEEEDQCRLIESIENKVKSLEKKMDVIDNELDALKEEEKDLVQDLEYSLGSHFVVV